MTNNSDAMDPSLSMLSVMVEQSQNESDRDQIDDHDVIENDDNEVMTGIVDEDESHNKDLDDAESITSPSSNTNDLNNIDTSLQQPNLNIIGVAISKQGDFTESKTTESTSTPERSSVVEQVEPKKLSDQEGETETTATAATTATNNDNNDNNDNNVDDDSNNIISSNSIINTTTTTLVPTKNAHLTEIPSSSPDTITIVVEKKKRGRPNKNSESNVISSTTITLPIPLVNGAKRGRGRPRKYPIELRPSRPKLPPLYDDDGNVIKRKRGRPRKNPDEELDNEPKIKRPRGRPRKNPLLLNELVRQVQNANAAASNSHDIENSDLSKEDKEALIMDAIKNATDSSNSSSDSKPNNLHNSSNSTNNKLPSLNNLPNLPNISELPDIPRLSMQHNDLNNMSGLNISGMNGMNMSGMNMNMGMNSMNINSMSGMSMNLNDIGSMSGMNGMNPYGGNMHNS